MKLRRAPELLRYAMGYFANGGLPVEPWSLYLNFNHKHQMKNEFKPASAGRSNLPRNGVFLQRR